MVAITHRDCGTDNDNYNDEDDDNNAMMTPQLVSELERINDREVALSPRDHSAIPDMIRPRQTQAFRCYLVYNRLYSVMYYLLRFPVPQPGPRLASSTSHHPLPPQSRGPGLSFSRRNPSGASVASSRSYLKPSHCQCADV